MLAQPSLQHLHFHECKFTSDRSMRGISKLRGLRSLDFPEFRAVAGELLSELAQLTDLETLNLDYSSTALNPRRVSETCLPLSTALSLLLYIWPTSGMQTLTARRALQCILLLFTSWEAMQAIYTDIEPLASLIRLTALSLAGLHIDNHGLRVIG